MTNVINAIKLIYPDIKGGFVYWETNKDGSSWKDPIDGLVWENKEFLKPTWDQIQNQSEPASLQSAKDKKKQELIDLKNSKVKETLMEEIKPIIDLIDSLKTTEEVHAFDITQVI